MAITPDQNLGSAGIAATSTTIAFTTTAAVAVGGFIVLEVSWYSGATLNSVAGGGLTWFVAAQGAGTSDVTAHTGIAWAQAPAGLASGTTITATLSATSIDRTIGGGSFTGVATSSPVDTTSGPTNGTTAAWASASTAIAAGSLLVAVNFMTGFTGPTNTVTAPSAEIVDRTDTDGNSATLCYRIEPTAGSYTVAGLWTAAAANVTIAVAFRAATVVDPGPRSTYFAPSLSPARKFRVPPLPQGINTSTTTPVSDNDTGSGTEDATVSAGLTGTDTGAGADTSTVTASETGSDTGSGAEGVTLTGLYPAADTGSGTDTAVSVTAVITGADTGSGTDTASVAGSEAGSDTGSGANSGVIAAAISGADTGSDVETASLTVTITAGDTGTFTDTATASGGSTPSGADTGSGVESGSVVAGISGTDTGSGTDAATVATTESGADGGAGADVASTTASEAGSDVATLTQTATLTGLYPAADVAAVVNAAIVTATLAAEDSGHFDDSATLTVTITVTDTGLSVETATVFATGAGHDITVISIIEHAGSGPVVIKDGKIIGTVREGIGTHVGIVEATATIKITERGETSATVTERG